ncbi:hypothetical protein C8R44DRAFT_781201 [Mycena epipterygia]|nr:hypothetical protein C8R44DRAFT_781201 [Mycena epipterygia]
MSTRRQSGRLAKQALEKPVSPKIQGPSVALKLKPSKKGSGEHKPAEEDGSDEEESEVESDASEYGNLKRPAKRQKLNKVTTSTVRKRKSPLDKTCYLTTITLDVLFEIFGHLGPKDLILLARTNHDFRARLLSKETNSIWKQARVNIDGPDCPTDLSEQRWAHLLYGEARCQSCGAKNIQRVDFGLRRRACTKCLKANLVVTSSFKKRFPHLEKTILDLIPYTNIGGFAHGHASSSNFYWRPDIEEMAEVLGAIERDVNLRVIGARKKLEDFTAERIALVEAVVDHAAICNDWSRQSVIRRHEEETRKLEQRYDAIKAKFIKLGYEEDDILCLRHEIPVRQQAPLTDRIWNKICPELEPLVQARKALRLKKEHEARIESRTRLAGDIYKEYKKTLLPAQWCYLPGLYEVIHLPIFSIVMNAADDVNVEAIHFKEAVDALPGFTVSWAATRKTQLAYLVDQARTSGSAPSGTQNGPASSGTVSLDLATTVFKCAQRSCSGLGSASKQDNTLIGWDAAAAHHCRDNGYAYLARIKPLETILEFSMTGSTAAASLVALAGLDEKRATCAEMDRFDLRVLCIACSPQNTLNGKQSHNVFSWRTAVSHFANSFHSVPSWRQLTGTEAQEIKADALADPTLSWTCNHCPDYLDSYHTYGNVTEHVKNAHAIASPTVPNDLFRYPNIPRPPVTFLTQALQYHCKRCSKPGTGAKMRIFNLNGVQCHLKDKHKILTPVPNRDWETTT